MASDERRVGKSVYVGGSESPESRVVIGDLVLDLRGRAVRVSGRSVPLTRIEFDILAYLAAHPGWVSSADQLMEDVWGYRSLGDARTVAVHIGNLRKKLGESKDEPRFIQTVRGAGYKLVDWTMLQNDSGGAEGSSHMLPPDTAAAGHGDGTEITSHAAFEGMRPETQRGDRSGPLIGREHEMAVLTEAWKEASGGRGGVVLLTGEAGIGKTRLAEELAAFAERSGGLASWGQCLAALGLPAYWPWIQILTHVSENSTDAEFRDDTQSGVAELAAVIPEFRRRALSANVPGGAEADVDRELFFRAMVDYLMRTSSRRPLLLVLDDLNTADPSSLQVLRILAHELACSSMLVLTMYRESALRPGQPLAETIDSLTSSRCRHVRAGNLSPHDVERVMSANLGREVSPALAQTIHEKTAGNPFFVVELSRLFAAEGRLADVGTGPIPAVTLPLEVQGVIERHIARLSTECRDLLVLASLLGASLDILVLSGASGLSGDRLLQLLDQAMDARLLAREAETGKLRFVHPLVREVLARERGETERLRLHARIAETLEAHSIADPETLLPELAYHFARAAPLGFGPQAFDYSRRAGSGAIRRFAHEEAADHYSRALTLLPCSGLDVASQRHEAAVLHEEIGDALTSAARRGEAVRAFERASSFCASDDRFARARLKRKIGSAWLADQEPARAQSALKAAEGILGAPPASTAGEHDSMKEWTRERLEIILERMAAFYFCGEIEELSLLLEEARPFADSAGTPKQLAVFTTHYLARAFRLERYRVSEETLAYAREHWRRLHSSGDEALACEAEYQLGFALLWANKIEEAHRRLVRCVELAEATRDHSHLVRARTYLSVTHRLRGHIGEARAEAARVVERATEAHLPGYVAAGKATLAWASLREGDVAQAEEQAREALDLWRAPSAYPFEWLARWPLVHEAVRRGRLAEAREHVVRMLEGSQQAPPVGLAATMQAVANAKHTEAAAEVMARAMQEAELLNYC